MPALAALTLGQPNGQRLTAALAKIGGASAVNDRIVIDPAICHGQACVRGTRIPVHQVVRMLANGDAIEDLQRAYPTLGRDDILACLDHAATLAEEQITPLADPVDAS